MLFVFVILILIIILILYIGTSIKKQVLRYNFS